MDFLSQLQDLGLAAMLALSAIGSALGSGVASMAAIGAWKKCFAQNKAAPFILTVFAGAPLSQTVYGMIVMNTLATRVAAGGKFFWPTGILAGLAMGLSAWVQGRVGAVAADAMGETGKGFGNYIMVVGMIETVAIFTMVFTIMGVGKI